MSSKRTPAEAKRQLFKLLMGRPPKRGEKVAVKRPKSDRK